MVLSPKELFCSVIYFCFDQQSLQVLPKVLNPFLSPSGLAARFKKDSIQLFKVVMHETHHKS
jgi:hypothetical protein